MNQRVKKTQRVGVYGGTFDPPHIGHLIIAETARMQLGLRRVLFVPAANAPHKRGQRTSGAGHRVKMLQLALRGSEHFRVSDMEVRRGGISYTVETIRELTARSPDAEFWLIVGSDNLRDFFKWKEPKEVLKRCRVAVYRRPGFAISPAIVRRTKAVVLEGGMLDISATVIRRLRQRSGSVRFLVPAAVERYLRRHHLYRAASRRTKP